MPCGCWEFCLSVLALVGVNSSFASSSWSHGRCHSSSEAQPTPTTAKERVTAAPFLLQVSQVRDATAWAYAAYEPQSSTGLVLMHGHRVANRTANAEGTVLTQQPGPNVDWHAWWHASLKQWHAFLLASQNNTLVLVELGSRALQAAAQGSTGPWGWIGLAMGLGLASTVILIFIMSFGSDQRLHRHDFPAERRSMWPSNVDMPRPSAKFGPRASAITGQRASLLAGEVLLLRELGERSAASPTGVAYSRRVSDQSLGPAESYPVGGRAAFAMNSQPITTVPESEPQVPTMAIPG